MSADSDPTLTRQRLKDIAALARRKGRDASGEFLIEGVRSVEAALFAKAPLLEIVASAEAASNERLRALLDATSVPVHQVAAHEMRRLGDAQTSQGVAAVSRSIVTNMVPEVSGPSIVLALDGVQDPGNVGAIIRTAAWFGATLVLSDTRSADPEGPKAVRAAMGGLWDVTLARVPDLGAALAELAGQGYAISAAEMEGTALADWQVTQRHVLVLGSEAHGISESVAGSAGDRVCIPRGGDSAWGQHNAGSGVESLNVVVAAGILMQHMAARNRPSDPLP